MRRASCHRLTVFNPAKQNVLLSVHYLSQRMLINAAKQHCSRKKKSCMVKYFTWSPLWTPLLPEPNKTNKQNRTFIYLAKTLQKHVSVPPELKFCRLTTHVSSYVTNIQICIYTNTFSQSANTKHHRLICLWHDVIHNNVFNYTDLPKDCTLLRYLYFNWAFPFYGILNFLSSTFI